MFKFNVNPVKFIKGIDNLFNKLVTLLDEAADKLIVKINEVEATLEDLKAVLTKVQKYSQGIKNFIN